MKIMFTKLLSVTILMFVGLSLFAQDAINFLTVTSPASIAGDYRVTPAAFGLNDVEAPFSGDLLLIEDGTDPTSNGCEPAVNDLTGFIAFIDRGECAFVDKAQNAMDAGAVAIVVCNNVPEDGTFAMGGDLPDFQMPAVMATFEDCQTIRAEFGGTVSVDLQFIDIPCIADCGVKDFPANTVWGANGEGGFACGLGDWTSLAVSDEISVWAWDDDTVPVGQFGAPRDVESATACNGAAQMDFTDYNIANGGPNTAVTTASNLISPIMDMTGIENPVLNFDQYLCTLSENQVLAWVTYSRDGGTTWLDTTPIVSNNFINTGGQSPEFVSESITMPFCGDEVGNTDQFRVQFIANGNFYFWTIDDVFITDDAIADAVAFEGWFAGAPNFQTPTSQVDELRFMIDANNEASNTGFDSASYTATVSDASGAELFSTTQDLGALPRCTNVENTISPDVWAMSPDIGQYSVNYALDVSGPTPDSNPDNNTAGSNFWVTDFIFSKLLSEADAQEAYMVGLGQNATYITYANGYFVPNGENFRPASITTGFGTDILTDFGFTTLTAEVREWIVDANGDGFANLETETRLIAQGQALLDPSNPVDQRLITIELDDFGTEEGFAASGQYLAMVHVAPLTPPADDTFMAPLSSGFVNGGAGNKDYFFAPTDFAFANSGVALGRPSSLSDFAGAAGTPTDQGARVLDPADGTALSWYLTMEIMPEVSSTVDIDDSIGLDVYPNPASNFFSVDLNLEEVSDNVNVQIVDLTGKVVANNNFNNVKDDVLKIATDNISTGVYMVNVFTDSGVKSTRLVIQ